MGSEPPPLVGAQSSRRRSLDLVGKVQTVAGPIPSERLGVTMTHEHLLSDFSGVQKVPAEASRKAKYDAPVTMDLLGSGFKEEHIHAMLVDTPKRVLAFGSPA